MSLLPLRVTFPFASFSSYPIRSLKLFPAACISLEKEFLTVFSFAIASATIATCCFTFSLKPTIASIAKFAALPTPSTKGIAAVKAPITPFTAPIPSILKTELAI